MMMNDGQAEAHERAHGGYSSGVDEGQAVTDDACKVRVQEDVQGDQVKLIELERNVSKDPSTADLHRRPILIVPGIMSSALELVESDRVPRWQGKRLWLNLKRLGFTGKLLGQKSEIKTDKADIQLRDDWVAHLCLNPDLVEERQGVKVRPVKGLKGCAFLEEGLLAPNTYVFGLVIRYLVKNGGYTEGIDLDAATYDWRLPPKLLEERDGYFTSTLDRIEELYKVNNSERVVLLCHSMGCLTGHYLLNFANATRGRAWIDKHIHMFIPVGGPALGAAEPVKNLVVGSTMGLPTSFLSMHSALILGRSFGSVPWLFPVAEERGERGESDQANDIPEMCQISLKKHGVLTLRITQADVREIAKKHKAISKLRIGVTVGGSTLTSPWFRPLKDRPNKLPNRRQSFFFSTLFSTGKNIAEESVGNHSIEMRQHDVEHVQEKRENEDGEVSNQIQGVQDQAKQVAFSEEEKEEKEKEEEEKQEGGGRDSNDGVVFRFATSDPMNAQTEISISVQEEGYITKRSLLKVKDYKMVSRQTHNATRFVAGIGAIFVASFRFAVAVPARLGHLVSTSTDGGKPISTYRTTLGEFLNAEQDEIALQPVSGFFRAMVTRSGCSATLKLSKHFKKAEEVHRQANVPLPNKVSTICVPKRAQNNKNNNEFCQYNAIDLVRMEGCRSHAELFEGPHYSQDPLLNVRAPPVDRVHAIFGVDVQTPISYAFKRNNFVEKEGRIRPLYVLDGSARLSDPSRKLKINDGAIYETKDTPQEIPGSTATHRGSGDGTVPYRSLQHVRTWANETNLTVTELPGVKHREILGDENFHAELLSQVLLGTTRPAPAAQ